MGRTRPSGVESDRGGNVLLVAGHVGARGSKEEKRGHNGGAVELGWWWKREPRF